MIDYNFLNKELNKLLKNQKCLIAFSGGPDSVFLLNILVKYYLHNLNKIVLAYVNYHDSKYTFFEEQIVNKYINEYGLVCYKLYTVFDKDLDHNFESWARKIRYNFFFDICKIEKIKNICVAHHKDDLIETYLIQKERNNLPFLYGLKSRTKMKKYNIIRPLTNLYKDEIKDELKNNNLLFYDDITNYYDKNKRNQIRNKNMNAYKKENIIQEINFENLKLNKLYREFKKVNNNNLDFYLKLDENEKKRYLFFILDKKVKRSEIEGYVKLAYDFLKRKQIGILSLNDKLKLYKLIDSFFITSKFNHIEYNFKIESEGKYENDIFSIVVNKKEDFNIKKYPFYIRNVKAGDYISTNIKTKNVHNFLKKQKTPIYLRDIYPVFVNTDNEIFYVPFYSDIVNKKINFSFNIDKEY